MLEKCLVMFHKVIVRLDDAGSFWRLKAGSHGRAEIEHMSTRERHASPYIST